MDLGNLLQNQRVDLASCMIVETRVSKGRKGW